MKRFEEIKNEFKNTGKYKNTVGYNAIGDLIQMVDLLIKRNGNDILYEGMKHKINNEWVLKIKEKLWELDKNERERINKIRNPNEMFPNLIYISNKNMLEQLLKEGEENV